MVIEGYPFLLPFFFFFCIYVLVVHGKFLFYSVMHFVYYIGWEAIVICYFEDSVYFLYSCLFSTGNFVQSVGG
jgi:hypothetical protein